MSGIDEKSPKHCADKQSINFHKFDDKFEYYFYHNRNNINPLTNTPCLAHSPPKKSGVSLKQAEINQLNITGPTFFNSSFELTLLASNPNKKIRIYYDEFLFYALLQWPKITSETSIVPFYQDHMETELLTISLVGNQKPVDPYQVAHDQSTGRLAIEFEATGKLRVKVGSWVSEKYRFGINCMTIFPFGYGVSPPLSSQEVTVRSMS